MDDDPLIRQLGRELLERLGYRVVTVADAVQALEVFQGLGKTDLVLLDYQLPGMDGYRLFRELKGRDGGVRVLLASGFIPARELARLQESGVQGVIYKPFRLTELEADSAGLDGSARGLAATLVRAIEAKEHRALALVTGGLLPLRPQQLGGELPHILQIRDVGGDEPEACRGLPAGFSFRRVSRRICRCRGDFRPMVIIFKGPFGEVVDVDPIPGLKFLFQAGYQGANLFPVHQGAEVFPG